LIVAGDRPTLITIPASDAGFREHVARTHEAHPEASPRQLELRLRQLFPRVLVRERALSGETRSWYVYRDGHWLPPAREAWWTASGVPSLSISEEGWIIDANSGAVSLLGMGQDVQQSAWHYTDFVAPGTLADVMRLFGVVGEGHDLDATVLLRPTSGDVIALDLHASRDGSVRRVQMRLAVGIPTVPSARLESSPAILCRPEADAAFARYAEACLARMPEPTAEGLELRLRRLYPHAHVSDGQAPWAVTRDRSDDLAPDARWWLDESLPRVRYDPQALILEANEPARALLGSELVGHHWQEFVTPGSTEEVAAMLAILADVGAAESRFRMPDATGRLVEFDSYTTVGHDEFITIMKPRTSD